jgi:hypothetical protein
MPRRSVSKAQLRSQVESLQAALFPSPPIEDRIAAAFMAHCRFEGELDADELGAILHNVVYHLFAEHKVAGRDVGLLHTVPLMEVAIEDGEAAVAFTVHMHRPIVAFLEFSYVLINDPVSIDRQLRLKRDTLAVREHTRTLDLKARAALAAIDVANVARRQLADVSGIIKATLPPQLARRGLDGHIRRVELHLEERRLQVCLEGDCGPVAGAAALDAA